MNKHQRKIIGREYGYKPKMKDIVWFMNHIKLVESTMGDPYTWVTSMGAWELSFRNQTIKLVAVNEAYDNSQPSDHFKSMPAVAAAAGWKVLTGPVVKTSWNPQIVPTSTHETHNFIRRNDNEVEHVVAFMP